MDGDKSNLYRLLLCSIFDVPVCLPDLRGSELIKHLSAYRPWANWSNTVRSCYQRVDGR